MLPATDYDELLFLLPNVVVGDRVLFTHNRGFSNVLQCGTGAAPSFPRVYVVLLGTPWALLDLFSPDKGTGNPNSNISKKLLDHNNIICLQEVHGKDQFLQAIQVLAPQFRLFGTFLPANENAGGSAICIHRDLLPEEAIVTHSVSCHGRDHLVNIRSERHSLVIVNVHFEPELTLGSYVADWVLFTRTGRHIPMVWALFWVTSISVTLKKDEVMFGINHSPMVTRERLPCSTLSFHTSLSLPNLITQDKTLQPLETYAPFHGSIVFLTIYLWLKHVISIALLMLTRPSGKNSSE